MTVGVLPVNRTRLPFELGCSPSPACITPALTSSSLYLPMAVRISVFGMTPASESLLAFTKTMTRIGMSPLYAGPAARALFSNRTAGAQIDSRVEDHAAIRQ